MDQKHRDYCIRLGNPYYIKESQKQYEEIDNSSWDNFAINDDSVKTDDKLGKKNIKKFTN